MKSDYSASDFLDPEKFRTGHDVCEARAQQRYHDGCETCRAYEEVTIAINDTVGAKVKGPRGQTGQANGYERLGYHAYTADFLQAILDSGCPVWVARIGSDGRIEKTRIA